MPAPFLPYYTAVADRIVLFLAGRRVAVEQRFPGSDNLVFRRHAPGAGADTWIHIDDRDDLIAWARQYAVGLHAHIRSEKRGAWFVIDIDSRERPLEMARLAAIHTFDVLTAQGIAPLVTFSGSDGFHVMWDVPRLGKTSDAALWELERAVVRSVACEVERLLRDDPAARPIREAVGAGQPLITTSSADREHVQALLFDEYILKDNANFRVPFSIHPHTGLASVPLDRAHLATFTPEEASPKAVAAQWPTTPLPRHTLRQVRQMLEAWRLRGC